MEFPGYSTTVTMRSVQNLTLLDLSFRVRAWRYVGIDTIYLEDLLT